ncbi:hypothetical protein OS493_003404 [Desmophyllum pertusum]|uniref:RING-type domain-containing protein n=1 Tax=Desmophyllum pertusum TaxID=174260 RepID=A0A9X0A5V1_9CNID|nr:hypothetical protein OS493_003404 [Desmophyllum pertusum]
MDEVRKKVHLAVKEKQFILLVEDDIHFIHAPRKPSSSTTSTSWHMCTALADIHDEIEAVPQNVDINQNHRSVRVTMTDGTVRQCRGGIDINHLLGYLRVKLPSYFSSSYLSSLPGEYKMFDLSNVQHSFENLRVYWDAARNEMETLRTSWLLDEFQQNLHSKADYSAALNHLLEVCPELGQYMADFQLVLTGDFPTWKYNKKLVAEWNEGVARRMPLIIPWQGPFHVVLNAEESTVQIFWAFFEKLYKALFGRNKRFPKKPKSEKVSLISTAAFGGWLIIREYVLDLFGPCKDPQYVMLVNLLDEISCFNFFFYTAFFRGGNFETWLHSLLRGSMMFINFRRRNYDKATLCQLSDILFHVSNNVGLGERIQQFLQVFTEKKVEILHSVLRRCVPIWAEPHIICMIAHALSGRRFDAEFSQWFLPNYLRGHVGRDLTGLSLKSAEFLFDLFSEVWCTLGQTVKVPRGNRKFQPYYFPALDTTMDQRAMPMAYSFLGNEPDSTVCCDLTHCQQQQSQNWRKLNCGHSFHATCLGDRERSLVCPICHPLLEQRIRELSTTMNRYLAGDELDSDESDQESDDDDDNDEDPDSTGSSFDEPSQSQVDEFKLKVQARARVLTQNHPQSVLPQFGNAVQKPTTSNSSDNQDHQQPVVRDLYRCQQEGCGKICKSLGGLTLHSRKMHKK